MAHQTETDIDNEPVLDIDSRKGVLIFFGFLVICGCFFVAGYVMGNKAVPSPENYADASLDGNLRAKGNSGIETYSRLNETAVEPVKPPSSVIEPAPAPPEIIVPYAAVSDRDRREPSEIAPAASPAVSTPVVSTPVTVDKPKPQPNEAANKTASPTAVKATSPAKQAASATAAYSVQVAAFRARREAEIKAGELEAKGFDARIESPPTPGDYYRLKVGSFATRAAAAEMAERLKQNGFDTMISETKGN